MDLLLKRHIVFPHFEQANAVFLDLPAQTVDSTAFAVDADIDTSPKPSLPEPAPSLYTPYFQRVLERLKPISADAVVRVDFSNNRPLITQEIARKEAEFSRDVKKPFDTHTVILTDASGHFVCLPPMQGDLALIARALDRHGITVVAREDPFTLQKKYLHGGREFLVRENSVIIEVVRIPDSLPKRPLTDLEDILFTDSDMVRDTDDLARFLGLAYLVDRTGLPLLEKAGEGFSVEGAIQAWHRVHPNLAAAQGAQVGIDGIGGNLDRDRFVKHTPFVRSPELESFFSGDDSAPEEILLKVDAQQRRGSFKQRGATNAIGAQLEKQIITADLGDQLKDSFRSRADTRLADISAAAKKAAVIAASHGNHANGVADAASHYGIEAESVLLVLPLDKTTQIKKIAQCLNQGAMVYLYGPQTGEGDVYAGSNLEYCMQKAQVVQSQGLRAGLGMDNAVEVVFDGDIHLDDLTRKIHDYISRGQRVILTRSTKQIDNFEKKNRLFVHTYDSALVAMGQGTDAAEMIAREPRLLDKPVIEVVAAGGLGKIAGDISLWRWRNARARVIGTNDMVTPVFARSLALGKYDAREKEFMAPEAHTRADGSKVDRIGETTFRQAQEMGAEAALVTAREIDEAIIFAKTHIGVPAEILGDSGKFIIEGAPASAIAAVLNGAVRDMAGKPVIISITGRNIDKSSIEAAEKTSGWVAEHPEVYKTVARLRRHIRATLPQPSYSNLGSPTSSDDELLIKSSALADRFIEHLNASLDSEDFRMKLGNAFYEDGNEQKQQELWEDLIESFGEASEDINKLKEAPNTKSAFTFEYEDDFSTPQITAVEQRILADVSQRNNRAIDMLSASEEPAGSNDHSSSLRKYLSHLIFQRRNQLSELVQNATLAGKTLTDAEIESLADLVYGDIPALLAAASPAFLTTQMSQKKSAHESILAARHLGDSLLPENHKDYGIQTNPPTREQELQRILKTIFQDISPTGNDENDLRKMGGILANVRQLFEYSGNVSLLDENESRIFRRLWDEYPELENAIKKYQRSLRIQGHINRRTGVESEISFTEARDKITADLKNYAQAIVLLTSKLKEKMHFSDDLKDGDLKPDILNTRAQNLAAAELAVNIYAALTSSSGKSVIHFDDATIADAFTKNTKGAQERTRVGIHSWDDLATMIISLADTAGPDSRKPVFVELHQYNFPTLHPSGNFLERLQMFVLETWHEPITISLRGDPRRPAQAYHITNSGTLGTVNDTLSDTAALWHTPMIKTRWLEGLESDSLELLHAASAFERTSNIHPHATRSEFLELVYQEMKASRPAIKRTQVLGFLKKLRAKAQAFSHAAFSPGFIDDVSISPAEASLLAATTPVDLWLARHPDPEPTGWYSIGAGQMVAVLGFCRYLIDEGLLPMTFELAANDLQAGLTYEINELGTNREFLAKSIINHEDDVDIYVYNGYQRNEVLLNGRWQTALMSLKAKDIPKVIKDKYLQKVLGTIVEKYGTMALATPVKSYEDGEFAILPYLEVYKTLNAPKRDDESEAQARARQKLAGCFIVIAGFFAAPEILGFRKSNEPKDSVDITLTGPSIDSVLLMALGMSTAQGDEFNRFDSPWARLKIIANKVLPAFVNAAGANKNFLTKISAEELLDDLFQFPASLDETSIRGFNKKIEEHVRENVIISEEITSSILFTYGIYSDEYWSPRGVVEDFRNCLPANIEQMLLIKDTAKKILNADDEALSWESSDKMTALFGDIWARLKFAETDKAIASERIKNYFSQFDALEVSGRPLSSNDRTHRKRAAFTAELVELIRQKLGGGTRNSRDGQIDALIRSLYEGLADRIVAQAFAQMASTVATGNEYERFYFALAPKNWTQEGRNGYATVVEYLLEKNLPIPEKLWRAYCRYERIPFVQKEFTALQPRPIEYVPALVNIGYEETGISDAHEILPAWGLEKVLVVKLRNAVKNTSTAYQIFDEDEIGSAELQAALNDINKVLRPLAHACFDMHDTRSSDYGSYDHCFGYYPFITYRLALLSKILDRIQSELAQNNIPPERLEEMKNRLKEALNTTKGLLKNGHSQMQPADVARNIHFLCKTFGWVEKAIKGHIDPSGPDFKDMLKEVARAPIPRRTPQHSLPAAFYHPTLDVLTKRLLNSFAGDTDKYQRLLHLLLSGKITKEVLWQGGLTIVMGDTYATDARKNLDHLADTDFVLRAGALAVLATPESTYTDVSHWIKPSSRDLMRPAANPFLMTHPA